MLTKSQLFSALSSEYANGAISEDEYGRRWEAVDRALAQPDTDIRQVREPAKPKPRLPRYRPPRSPDRQASIERRRRLVHSGPLPNTLAVRFTWGEVAVMRIIGDECRAKGYCDLHIDAIAARAGVHRTTVQNALREAQGRGATPNLPIISVQERRRAGERSLTNIIHIVSKEWSVWIRRGPRRGPEGVGSKRTQLKKSSTTDTSKKEEKKRLGDEADIRGGPGNVVSMPERG